MRIVVLSPSNYSERTLAVMAALDAAGHTPVGCLCAKTLSPKILIRKLTEYGPRRFVQYAIRRLGWGRKGDSGKDGLYGRFENRYMVDRLKAADCRCPTLTEFCRSRKIALRTCRDVNAPKSISFTASFEPDVLVYTGGGILRKPLLRVPKIGVLNAHLGALPQYRGMNVMEWAMLNDDPLAVTVHLIDPGVDTGPILFSSEFSLPEEISSVVELRHFGAALSVDSLLKGVEMLAKGDTQFHGQAEGDGKQYFVMHEEMSRITESALKARIGRAS